MYYIQKSGLKNSNTNIFYPQFSSLAREGNSQIKRLFIVTIILFAILSLSLGVASCGSGEITKTITAMVEEVVTVIADGSPSEFTITEGIISVVIPNEAPDIPHVNLLELEGPESMFCEGELPSCFYCHPMTQIPDHTGFLEYEELCGQCHKTSSELLITPYAS